jgi:chromosome segregation ATPase
VADGDIGGIQSQPPSVSNEVQSQPPPVSNGVVKNPPASQKGHEVSTRDALEQARTALQTYDAELEEKRKEAAELQQELEREKGQIEELERIIRIKQAEAKMFAVRADEAQREAEGLQCIVLAKAEKIEQEYASNMAKLHLEEAEDHCHKAHNTLQVLQQAQLDFHTLQLPLLSELCDLLKQLDATRLQSSK